LLAVVSLSFATFNSFSMFSFRELIVSSLFVCLSSQERVISGAHDFDSDVIHFSPNLGEALLSTDFKPQHFRWISASAPGLQNPAANLKEFFQ
jgi:hypothetical protein